MSTLLIRIVRFGWLGGIILTLVAVAAIGVALVVAVAQPSAAAPATVPRQLASVSVSVTTTAQVLPTDLSHRPASDHEFIAVGVQLTNASARALDYNVSAFVLHDQTGSTFDPDPAGAYLIGSAALPTQGTLQPGTHRSGEIVFEVPMSDDTATLLWQPSGEAAAGADSWVLTI